MSRDTINIHAGFIWSIAELLCGAKYGMIVLPVTILRRLMDEAHSSQSGGKHADCMARVLADGGMTEEEAEIDATEERALLKLERRRSPNLSYLAFTATPKNK